MSNNITIKDANNTNVVLHTIEDSTSVHFNQSIPTDIANNTATVVSGGQAVASGMGALVVAQRDGLPAGTNLIGRVSVEGSVSIQQTGALYTQTQGQYLSTPPTLVNATVSTLQVDSRGALRTTIMATDAAVAWGFGSDNADGVAGVASGIPKVAGHTKIWNSAGSTWDRWDGKVSVGNTSNIAVSVAHPTFNLPVSVHPVTQSGTWGVNLNGAIVSNPNTAIITAANGALYTAALTYGWDGSNWRRVDIDTNGKANVSISNTLPVLVSLQGAIAGTNNDGQFTQVGLFVQNQNKVFNAPSGTWDRMTGTSVGLNVILAQAPSFNVPVSIAAGRVSTAGLVSVWDANTVVPDGDAKVWQGFNNSIGVATNYVFNRNSNTWDRMTGTSVGLAVVGTVSVTGPLPAGTNHLGKVSVEGLSISGIGTQLVSVGGAVSTQGVQIVGRDGSGNARVPYVDASGIARVSIEGSLAVSGSSMTQTVGAAVTTEGYPMLGSDGTNARRLLTTTGGALIVHVSNTAPGGGAGGSSMTQTVGAAVTTEGYPMLGSDGTNSRRLLTTTGGALIVHVSNTAPGGGSGGGSTQLVSVGGPVSTQGVQVVGSDGTNARTLLTTTGGALVVHVSNTAPGGGGGGGSTQLVSVGGAVSTQGVQIVGRDNNGDARTIKTNVSGVTYISTRTFMSQDVFTRPADVTAYAAGATAAPGNAGDLIANSTTNTAVKPLKFRIARGPGQVAYIRGARMYRTGGTLATGQHNIAGAIRLHLFNTNNKVSVAGGDNAALNASPVSNWMGYIDLVAIACAPGLRTSGAVSTQVYWGSPARTGEMIVNLSAAQVSIQGLLETRIAFTPINGEIFTVQIEGFNG